MDGTVRSAYLGADYQFGRGPLVGLTLSRTASSIDFESGINSAGTVDARLTSVYPYAQWSPRVGLSVWGLLGAGRGTADLLEDATRRQFETSIGMAMTAAGVRQRLTGVVAVKADAFAVRTDGDEVPELPGVATNVQRVRLASELGGRWGLSGGSMITSRVELGVRFDGGDAATGAGAEAGAVESGSGRRVNMGVRLSVLDAATVDLFGEHLSRGTEPTDRRLGLQGAVRFR